MPGEYRVVMDAGIVDENLDRPVREQRLERGAYLRFPGHVEGETRG